jgi:hypothetical protein
MSSSTAPPTVLWRQLTADYEAAVRALLAFDELSCRRAEAAHLIIMNHALLLSDVAVETGLCPTSVPVGGRRILDATTVALASAEPAWLLRLRNQSAESISQARRGAVGRPAGG